MPYGEKLASPVDLENVVTPWGNASTFYYRPGKSVVRLGTNTLRSRASSDVRPFTFVVVSRLSRWPKKTGAFVMKNGRRVPERKRVLIYRLKKKYLKTPRSANFDRFRGSNPNVLTYSEVVASEIPKNQNFAGYYNFQQWSATTSPFNVVAPMGMMVGGDVSGYFPQGAWFTKHPDYWSLVSEMREVATNRLHNKLKGQDFNAAVTLAQYGETAATIADVAVNAAKALVSLKRGDLKGLGKLVDELAGSKKQLASSHLQYTYGIAPLLSDIDGAMRALAELPRASNYFSVKTKEQRTFPTRVTVLQDDEFCYTSVTISGSVEFKLHARMQVDNLVTRNLSEIGVNSDALLNVAWELIPFSFVVDWFYPIGTYFNSLSSQVGLSPVFVTETIVVKQTITILREFKTREYKPSDGNKLVLTESPGNNAVTFRCFSCDRKLSSISPPVPPTLKNPLSGTHLLNAAALITQLFSKKR